VVIALGAALVASGCGGDDAAETTTTADATTTTEVTTTTEATTTTGGGDAAGSSELDGSWVADAGDLLAANTANVGGTGGLTCTGEITMTFADGKLERSGDVSCSAPGSPISAEGSIVTTGDYAVDGDVLTITGTSSTGRASLAGTEIPTPDSWGDGEATFRIEGDTLTIEFTETAVGAVTQTYTRSS
jgi:hypothetical protein